MSQVKQIPWGQAVAGLVLVGLMFVFGGYVGGFKSSLPLQLFIGVLIGYTLSRGSFGFAGIVRQPYITGNGLMVKAFIRMMFLTMVVYLGIQWFSQGAGALPAYAADGGAVIPGTQNVYNVNLPFIIGATVFGMGMVIAGGCASGTLVNAGVGQGRAFITLLFFIIGTLPGGWFRETLLSTGLGSASLRAFFPESMGYMGAFILSVVLLGIVYVLTVLYEQRRKSLDSFVDIPDVPPAPAEDKEEGSLLISMYDRVFVRPWSMAQTTITLALLLLFIPVAFGNSWGVTSAYHKIAATAVDKLGIPLSPGNASMVTDNLLADSTLIRNIGTVVGALVGILLAGKFRFELSFAHRDTLYYALAGLMLGFGSRAAGGCNAGALYAGIATFSLSGWVFLIFMTIGGVLSLKLFAGRVSTAPKNIVS